MPRWALQEIGGGRHQWYSSAPGSSPNNVTDLVQERIGDLLLDHAPARGAARPHPLLLVHGLNGGSWYLENYLKARPPRLEHLGRQSPRPLGQPSVPDLGRVSCSTMSRTCATAFARWARGRARPFDGRPGRPEDRGRGRRHGRGISRQRAAPRHHRTALGVLSRMWRYAGAILGSRPFQPRPDDAAALIANGLSRETQEQLYPRLVLESGRAARELALGSVAVDARRVRCRLWWSGPSTMHHPPRFSGRSRKYGATFWRRPGHAHMADGRGRLGRPFQTIWPGSTRPPT